MGILNAESGSALQKIVEAVYFHWVITALIIINTIILGLETYPEIMRHYGLILGTVDYIILLIFAVELTLRLLAYRKKFFRNPWAIFDTLVVAFAFVSASQAFSVLRALRVLRILRLVSIFPRLRRVVEGLMNAIPGIASIGAILLIFMYVFAVIGTKLYGAQYPEWFGDLQTALFSLFQVMTLEGWPDIVRTILKTNPYAWIFFVIYLFVATFSVLNLFIAVIVDAMQKQQDVGELENVNRLDQIQLAIEAINQKLSEIK